MQAEKAERKQCSPNVYGYGSNTVAPGKGSWAFIFIYSKTQKLLWGCPVTPSSWIDQVLEACKSFLLFICSLACFCFVKIQGFSWDIPQYGSFSLQFRVELGELLYYAGYKNFSSIICLFLYLMFCFLLVQFLLFTYQFSWIDLYLFLYFSLHLIFLYKSSDFNHHLLNLFHWIVVLLWVSLEEDVLERFSYVKFMWKEISGNLGRGVRK